MCERPIEVKPGVFVACRQCWQCLQQTGQVWTGKCIAESKTTRRTLALTLTYGSDARMGTVGNDMKARHLFYADVQLYLKRLRKHTDGKLRFFASGEYGSEKGRSHWHLIIFCDTNIPPNIQFDTRYIHTTEGGHVLWPHGWSYWCESSPQLIAYACKYANKNLVNTDESCYASSLKPALGTEYFKSLAHLYVSSGLSPQNAYYGFPDVLVSKGKFKGMPRKYRMSVVSAFRFCEYFVKVWKQTYGHDRWPHSDMLVAYLDAVAKREGSNSETWLADLHQRFEATRYERNRFTWEVGANANGERNDGKRLYLPFPVIPNQYLRRGA